MGNLIRGEKGLTSIQLLAAMAVAVAFVVLGAGRVRDIYAMGGANEMKTARTWATVSQETRERECGVQTLIGQDVCLQITAGNHEGDEGYADGGARVIRSKAGQVGFILPQSAR